MDTMPAQRTPATVPTVRDVMTSDPQTITPDTGFRDAVRLLAESGFDARPVVEGERLVGLVSSDDLLLKEEMVELAHGGSGLPWQRHRDRVRARGRQVGELMDIHPPTVREGTTLGRAARALHRRHRGCLLVVDEGGRLQGIVTRSDLLSVYLRDDTQLEADVAALLPDGDVRASVVEGCVVLEGRLRYRSQVERLTDLVRHVPGIVAVDDRLAADLDDLHLGSMGS